MGGFLAPQIAALQVRPDVRILGAMRGMVVVAVAWCLAGCQAHSMHRRVNHVLLGAASVTLACDYGQTMHAASDGWVTHFERNPILGETPSTESVTLYFAAIAGLGVASLELPEWARSALYVTTLAVQSRAIIRSQRSGMPWCGF